MIPVAKGKEGVTVRRRVAPPPAVPEPYVILFESYGSSVQVALVMGTMAGSVYALLELEDDPLKWLPRFVLPRLSMPLGICHSDEAPTGSYTLDLSGSASAYPWHYPGPWLLGPSCTRQACG